MFTLIKPNLEILFHQTFMPIAQFANIATFQNESNANLMFIVMVN